MAITGIKLAINGYIAYEFESFSNDFRLNRNMLKGVLQSQILINSGYKDVLNIDLK